MKNFVDDTGVNDGTPINRVNLMAAQGFNAFTFIETDTGFEIEYDFGSGNTETLAVSSAGGYITETYTAGAIVSTMTTEKTESGYEVSLS